MAEIGNAVTTFFGNVLEFLHDIVAMVPFLESAAWGWSIILLTLIIRIMLLPLAIKQTRSMRAMQTLQPQIKELQAKYKVDRDLMRKDPERYRARKQKLNEEMMSLYQREGANPLASCLPLLAQAPVFVALFWTLRGYDELMGAQFYFFTSIGDGGLDMLVSEASWPGWLLIALMSGSMFWSQRQMMARNAAQAGGDSNPMAQQQKILLYVMPVFLAVISFQFPLGILLYWVTTNTWQVAQQAIILREVQHEADTGTLAEHPGGTGSATSGKSGSSGAAKSTEDDGQATKKTKKGRKGKKNAQEASESSETDDGSGPSTTGGQDRSKGAGRNGRSATSGRAGSSAGDAADAASSDDAEASSSNGSDDDAEASSSNGSDDVPRPGPASPDRSAGPTGPAKRDHLPRRHEGPRT